MQYINILALLPFHVSVSDVNSLISKLWIYFSRYIYADVGFKLCESFQKWLNVTFFFFKTNYRNKNVKIWWTVQ